MLATNQNDQQSSSFSNLAFPERVHCILNLVELNRQEHVVSWMHNGAAFKVHDSEEFERDLLPRYFNASKYTSFTRALHAHGFKCERGGRQNGIFSHPWFNRYNTEDLSRIQRINKKGKMQAKAAITKSGNSESAAAAKACTKKKGSVSSPTLSLKRDGEKVTSFPSLLHNRNASGNIEEALFGRLFQTVSSQVAHRRITSTSSHSIDNDDGDDNSTALQPFSKKPASSSSSTTITNPRRSHHAQTSSLPQDYWSVWDDQILPISSSSNNTIQQEDFKYRTDLAGSHNFEDEMSNIVLEPRPIQAMTNSPAEILDSVIPQWMDYGKNVAL